MIQMDETKFYTQNHSIINGRNIWFYMVTCPIGNICIVQYEQKDLQIKDAYLGFSNQKAEESYTKTSVKIAKGIL